MGDNMEKKEDKILQFPHAELSTKPANEVWMLYQTKIVAYSSSNYPNQVGWMTHEGLDEKKPLWGLESVPEFKQWLDELNNNYHPGPKPLKQHYRDLPIPPSSTGVLRRAEYDQDLRFYLTCHDKWCDKKAAKILEFQKAQGWLYLQMSAGCIYRCLLRLRKQP